MVKVLKIKDYNLTGAEEAEKVALNREKKLRILNISGITTQTLKLQVSNDAENWSTLSNDAGDGDFEITADAAIPLFATNCYLRVISEDSLEGVVATIGMKKGV